MEKVLLEKHEGYAIVTLNRPQEMNALSRELRADRRLPGTRTSPHAACH